MDQCMDIDANVEEPSHDHNNCTREILDSENIYEIEDVIQTLEPKRTGPALSGAGYVKKSSCIAAAVCLGLLCLLLLIRLITLVFLCNKSNSEGDQLQTSYNNLTKERDQLQTRYNNLTKERDQLQTRYNNLTKERDQLQTRYNNLTEERDQLQKRFDDIKLGWMNFSGSFYYISSAVKSWQQSRDDCQQRGADLVIINSKEEQEYIRSFQKRMWIGMTDLDTEGTWKWVDGTPVTLRFWKAGEPNNDSGRENCGEILKSDLEKNWNDVPCDRKQLWICEKRLP